MLNNKRLRFVENANVFIQKRKQIIRLKMSNSYKHSKIQLLFDMLDAI